MPVGVSIYLEISMLRIVMMARVGASRQIGEAVKPISWYRRLQRFIPI